MRAYISLAKIKGKTSYIKDILWVDNLLADIVFSSRKIHSSKYSKYKSLIDPVVGFLLLLFSSPLMIILMVLIRTTSGKSIFYRQLRVGRYGRLFWIYKFRTMNDLAGKECKPTWTYPNDIRTTKIGKFLRTTHLDELPQLWNIIKGEMALVGPRPERPEFLPFIEDNLPQYKKRLSIKPGLTGPAQIKYPSDLCILDVKRKLREDLKYIENISFLTDLKILFLTLPFLLKAFKRASSSYYHY